MHQTTPLSSGSLNGQTLTIELVEPGNDLPNAVLIRWPQKPTTASPAAFDQAVVAAMKSSPTPPSNWPRSGCGKSCEHGTGPMCRPIRGVPRRAVPQRGDGPCGLPRRPTPASTRRPRDGPSAPRCSLLRVCLPS